jgi:hypothetical protein
VPATNGSSIRPACRGVRLVARLRPLIGAVIGRSVRCRIPLERGVNLRSGSRSNSPGLEAWSLPRGSPRASQAVDAPATCGGLGEGKGGLELEGWQAISRPDEDRRLLLGQAPRGLNGRPPPPARRGVGLVACLRPLFGAAIGSTGESPFPLGASMNLRWLAAQLAWSGSLAPAARPSP